MGNKRWSLLGLVGLLLCLGGCFFQSAEELYGLPRSSETYVNLQSEIRRVMGSAEYTAPLTGSNTQPIQLVDLNGDGTQEAVAFFRDSTQEKPLQIALFSQDDKGDYVAAARIQGAATDIESIEYLDLGGEESLEVVVSWQVSAAVHTLCVYSLEQEEPVELMRSGYTSYLALDMDRDGKEELLLSQTDATAPENDRVELFAYREGLLDRRSAAPLSQGGGPILEFREGMLAEGTPALYVTCQWEETSQLTDIFTLVDDRLANITLDRKVGYSLGTLRTYTGVGVQDIDWDGGDEIPLPTRIASYTPVTSENFWEIDWWQYAADGTAQRRLTTYHNNSDRWYLVLPDAWAGRITLSRQESGSTERAVVFSYWTGREDRPPQAFLTIYRLTGASRRESAENTDRFVLWSDDEVTYAAAFFDCDWDCGLDQAGVIDRFHLITGGDWF